MDTLVSLGVSASYLWSLYALFLAGGGTHATYLEVASGVTALILLGRYLEARAKRSAGAALRALLDLGAKQATVLRDGHELSVSRRPARRGRRLRRPAGGEDRRRRQPSSAGSSAVDTSMLTGEPVPAEVGPGDAVTGGCVNVGRPSPGPGHPGRGGQPSSPSSLGSSPRPRRARAPVQRLADRVSAVFVPAVLVIAAATLAGWLAEGGVGDTGVHRPPVAVLIIACPWRDGAGHPDRDPGRHTGRGAQLGHPHQGPGDPGEHPPGGQPWCWTRPARSRPAG